ncbi:BLUF domain-containing protein [Paludibacterium yongneupense]|uniref:BLUF domain-containing protein n=1 Tax=Paludibacterium yongneupense TaxID=400061 RepID=UPI0003FC4C35|nr:BLUF domain-containing protein [Paludibacterium yongneupense]
MIRLIYSSASVEPLTAAKVAALLSDSRRRNQAAGIKGLLVVMNDDFMQVLEGEDAAVDALYARILADTRHSMQTLLSREAITHPAFANWSMAFIDARVLLDNVGLMPVALQNLSRDRETQRTLRLVREFIDGKWHHHLPSGLLPQVVHR